MTLAAIVVLSLAVLGAIGVATWTTRTASTPSAQSDAPAAPNDIDAVVAVDAATARHPVYRYSVIPGGAHSRAELVDAINRDEVVADHYRTVSLERVREESLTQARQAYVSYRINGRVYWTKHKVTLPAGEAILTDGKTTIRARCGNCIADEPQLPTAEEEPKVAEFDAVAPAVPAFLPSRGGALNGVPGLPDRAAALPADPSHSLVPLLPLIPFGLAASSPAQKRSPGQVDPSPDASGLAASISEPERHGPNGSTPDGLIPGGLIPGGLVPGTPTPGELIPGGLIPGTLIPQTLPDGPTSFAGDDWTRDVPEQPAPIPEPSTIVLLGTGVAGAMWRGVRSRFRR
jgi:hypothetical protein